MTTPQPQPVIRFIGSWGFIFLAIILIIVGIVGLIGHPDTLNIILDVMRIIAGVLILVGR